MHNIKIYQVECKVYLVKDITYGEMQAVLAGFVDQVIARQEKWLQFHNQNCFKNYVFSGFKKVAASGIYQEGSLNTFFVRCVDWELANYFQRELAIGSTQKIRGLACQLRELNPRMIQKLYLITPAIAKFEDGYWRRKHTLEEYQTRIMVNAIKKYNGITQDKMEEPVSLFYNFKLLNRVPIKVKYKEIYLLGDKFELVVTEEEKAQQLAKVILAAGALECNARGFGFANYKGM